MDIGEEVDVSKIKAYVEKEVITDYNRMRLHKMSSCNEKFLFEDRYLKKFFIFALVDITENKNDFKFLGPNKKKKQQLQYEFQMMYEVDFLACKTVQEIFNIKKGDNECYEKVQTILNEGLFNIQVEDTGTTTITYNKHEDESTFIEVCAIVFTKDGGIKDFHCET